ncbi:uncharacterized protein THITE_2020004, partial [Thermothielavioides terrestris NRRL 8126]
EDAASATEPAPERPMVPTSAADWESKKPIIRKLYMDQNLILNEVIEIMLKKHKFKATARMYKGQFAKWKWTKYNKTGKHSAIKPSKSRSTKGKSARSRLETPDRRVYIPGRSGIGARMLQLAPLSQHHHLQYFGDEDCQVESTLSAYAALILHWSERETPWKTDDAGHLLRPQRQSVLQHVRAAQEHFVHGRAQLGGELLRRAFLGIEAAVESALEVEALWDCCLAVPQLVLTLGWSDMLTIFARYLHQFTSIKLPGHP